ncbi:carbohydrate kinase family protein [Aquibium oceanicum]|uniref:Carbohydrate kinase n=1 Tax=Aquibium oceanicum TaxID=1670800 RepID=A0A1L3SUN4_9HYPH|nr:carbohydrate kinase [Aquibium oceanicum]APH73147.1 carbohydrate kinase [Aquibium oceanicum]
MILCCGEALIDMLPRPIGQEGTGYLPAPGGAVFNTAIALGRLGAPAGFFSGLSTDLFGRALEAALASSHVDTRLCLRSARPTTLAFVELEAGQARYTFYDENTAGRMIAPDDLPTIGGDVDAMLFGGISLVSEPCGSAYEALMQREHAARVMMFDPNIRAAFIADKPAHIARMRRMLAMADIVKLSHEDLAWFGEGTDADAVARSWLELGPSLVLVTGGGDDAVAYTKRGHVRVPPRKVDVVDTIGAGDTFNAGILAALHEAGLLAQDRLAELSEAQVRSAVSFANAAAAVTVSRAGANPPWRSEIA